MAAMHDKWFGGDAVTNFTAIASAVERQIEVRCHVLSLQCECLVPMEAIACFI